RSKRIVSHITSIPIRTAETTHISCPERRFFGIPHHASSRTANWGYRGGFHLASFGKSRGAVDYVKTRQRAFGTDSYLGVCVKAAERQHQKKGKFFHKHCFSIYTVSCIRQIRHYGIRPG